MKSSIYKDDIVLLEYPTLVSRFFCSSNRYKDSYYRLNLFYCVKGTTFNDFLFNKSFVR